MPYSLRSSNRYQPRRRQPVVGAVETPEVNQDKGFFVSRRKVDFGQNSSKAMTIAAIVAVVAIGTVSLFHREGAELRSRKRQLSLYLLNR